MDLLEAGEMRTTSATAVELVLPTPRRFVLPEFLSPQECKELEFIHRSCGVFGYRPFVLSTTLSHLVATNCAHLIIPILSMRGELTNPAHLQNNGRRFLVCERRSRAIETAIPGVKEAVEEYFGREYELFVEFTGLISWTKGANIGWHSDDNRSYLRQRHYSAVCYLNNYEEGFKGGLFHFQEGEPSTIIPSLGTLIIYTADERNMHRVDEVTEGERCTLALWFTSDREHDEDQKLIQQISIVVPDLQAHPLDEEPETGLGMSPPKQNVHPLAAPSVMYKAYNLQNESEQVMEGYASGELANPYFNPTSDLRVVRLALLGLSCCFSSTAVDDRHDNPVILIYKDKEVPHLFESSLEALQVTEFHQFRKAALNNLSSGFSEQCLVDPKWKSTMSDADSSHSQIKVGNCTSTPTGVSSPKAEHEELFDFLYSSKQFEVYTSNLWRKLFQLFPTWRATGSLTLRDL